MDTSDYCISCRDEWDGGALQKGAVGWRGTSAFGEYASYLVALQLIIDYLVCTRYIGWGT